jgi:hypothetical protein
MIQKQSWECVALLTLAGIAIAQADVPPWAGPPELLDKVYGKTIRDAGYDCPQVTNAAPTSDVQYRAMVWGGQNPLLVTCKNNRHFVFAVSPKRPINSSEPLPPPPAERIRAVEAGNPRNASAPTQSSVKAIFEKYNLLGTFAWDCSKPASKDNFYYVHRLLDADHVQRDQMSGPTQRDWLAV